MSSSVRSEPGHVLALALGVSMLLAPHAVLASDAADAILTEAEYLRDFDASHPALLATRADLERAAVARQQAGVLANPQLEAQYEAPDDQARQTTFALQWQPPLDGRRGAAIDAARSELDAARARDAWTGLELRAHARARFAAWAEAARRHELVHEHLQAMESLAATLRARADRGEESRMNAVRVDLAVAQVKAQLADATAELVRARADAIALHGALDSTRVPRLPALPSVPSAIDGEQRSDVEALRLDVDAARGRSRLAGRVLEFPALSAGWTTIEGGGASSTGPFLGLGWTLPLFDRHRAERAGARRAVAIAEARLLVAQRQATQDAIGAWQAYSTLHDSAAEVSAVVAAAADVVDAAGAAYLAGESTTTDLLETLRAVLESRLAALDLHARALTAHRRLELAAGVILDSGER